jgi:hypothetical protein
MESLCMLMIRIKRGENNRRLEQFAIHFSYNQTFIPIKGSMAWSSLPRHETGTRAQKAMSWTTIE